MNNKYTFTLPPAPTSGTHLIPELGQGLQKYAPDDLEAIDPTNTMEVFQKEIWPHIRSHFTKDARVLDVGSGNGRFSSFLADHVGKVVAIDAFRDLNPKHQRDNIEFMRSSLQDYEGTGFDVIFLFGVMYLQESWGLQEAVNRMALKLNPGGVILTVDDKKRDVSTHPTTSLQPGFYNLTELCTAASLTRESDFIQQNNVHRITTLRK